MSNLDYWYEKTAKELMCKMLSLYNGTDWSMDELYDLVRQTGELDLNKYSFTKTNDVDILIKLENKGIVGYR